MSVKKILDEVHESLEPLRKAKADAMDQQAHALALKQQSAANVVEGEKEADRARLSLDDHTQAMKSKKAARAQARAERIASGGKTELPATTTDDAESQRLRDDAEEADAAYINLKEIDGVRSVELQEADAAVVAARTHIYLAHVEGIAAHMIEHDSLIRELHAELSALVPSAIDSKPGTYERLSPTVRKAMGLVTLNALDTPVNKLRGYELTPGKWTPNSGPRVHTGFQDEHPMRVPGPLPRNVDGIPQKI